MAITLRLRRQDRRRLKGLLKLSFRPLVVSAGMPRSGSTLLFNILRETLATRWGDGLSAGWIHDLGELPRGRAFLIKVHTFEPFYRLRAAHSFYTYRDVRVAAVSRMRMFNLEPTLKRFRWVIEQYQIAKASCDLIIKYEDLIADPLSHTQAIARRLDITTDCEAVVAKVLGLRPPTDAAGPYSMETLLHEGHVTNTGDDEWRRVLPRDLQDQVHAEFGWWFEECGYPPR